MERFVKFVLFLPRLTILKTVGNTGGLSRIPLWHFQLSIYFLTWKSQKPLITKMHMKWKIFDWYMQKIKKFYQWLLFKWLFTFLRMASNMTIQRINFLYQNWTNTVQCCYWHYWCNKRNFLNKAVAWTGTWILKI